MYLLRAARKSYLKIQKVFNIKNELTKLPIDYSNQLASDLIKSRLIDNNPCMICRFGNIELEAVNIHLNVSTLNYISVLEKSLNYILGKSPEFWWNKNIKEVMRNNAGFFPVTDQSLENFGYRMLEDIKNIDILGSWLNLEVNISHLLRDALIVKLADLEPYYHFNPWTEALKDKKVLVIHPFEQSIQQQYKKRVLLFKDQRILPEFELTTFKPVQSIANNNVEFETWFDALDWMCKQINNIQFDIAIIGAGAYGLPLASYIKNMGKKAIHLGGATQILFGIKGKRWDDREFFQNLYNPYWTRPLPSETPNNFQCVEGGCYW
jgi:hypothetical protein